MELDRLQTLAPDARRIMLPPKGVPGGPRKEAEGLEGLLRRRVQAGRVEAGGSGERSYPLLVRTTLKGEPLRLLQDRSLVLERPGQGPPMRVHFHRSAPRRGVRLWFARLGEGLVCHGPGGHRLLLLDGDGDGRFSSLGKDLMVLQDPLHPPLPLSAHLLLTTGGYRLELDRRERLTWHRLAGPLALLLPDWNYRESVQVLDLVVGTGRSFRHLPPRSEGEPVTGGTWFPLRGRLSCGLEFKRDGECRIPGVKVEAGGEARLRLGGPFVIKAVIKDRGDKVRLESIQVTGAAGEVYTPDGNSSGEPLMVHVEVLVGPKRRQRQRAAARWSPWQVSRRGEVRQQVEVVEVGANWNPLTLEFQVRRGPLAGAEGSRRLR